MTSVKALRMALPLGIACALGGCEALLFLPNQGHSREPEAPVSGPARQQDTAERPVRASPKHRVNSASATLPSQPARRVESTAQQRGSAILARLPVPRPPDDEPVTTGTAVLQELSRVSYPVPSPTTVRPPEPEPSGEHVAQERLGTDRCECSDLFCAQPLKDCGQLWAPSP